MTSQTPPNLEPWVRRQWLTLGERFDKVLGIKTSRIFLGFFLYNLDRAFSILDLKDGLITLMFPGRKLQNKDDQNKRPWEGWSKRWRLRKNCENPVKRKKMKQDKNWKGGLQQETLRKNHWKTQQKMWWDSHRSFLSEKLGESFSKEKTCH